LIFRRLPGWGYFFIFGMSLSPSVYSLVREGMGDTPWTVQERGGWVLAWGGAAMVLAWLARGTATARHVEREREFFDRMERPVDFETEVGGACDREQAVLLGRSVAVMGALMFAYLLVPNPTAGRWQIAALAGGVLAVGLGLWAWGGAGRARSYPSSRKVPPAE
jgi:hypothetical protein